MVPVEDLLNPPSYSKSGLVASGPSKRAHPGPLLTPMSNHPPCEPYVLPLLQLSMLIYHSMQASLIRRTSERSTLPQTKQPFEILLPFLSARERRV